MNEPLVSVIVTCYNYAHFLPDALDSVSNQSCANWECIIVDDESTDNTPEVANSYVSKDARFRYVRQKNTGLAGARNAGMQLAKGEFFQFLDADDKIAVRKLEQQVAYLETHQDTDIVYGNFYFFRSEHPEKFEEAKDRKGKSTFSCPQGRGSVIIDALLRNNFMVVSAPLVRRRIFDSGLHFDTGYNTFEDWKFWLEAAFAGNSFAYLPLVETETFIRFGHSSMMSALIRMNKGGMKIRHFINPHLNFGQRCYNRYRMLKLQLKYWYLTKILRSDV